MKTNLYLKDGNLTVENVQDVGDILELNKFRREENVYGSDFRYKWNLPSVMVNKFYNEYNEGLERARPMNQEFWIWVDKKLNDPDFSAFKTSNSSNPFNIGFRK